MDCDNGFGDAAKRANCAAACASLCGFTTEFVGYQIGLAPAGGRPYCPAPKLPVCMLGVGSSAAGRIFCTSTIITGNLSRQIEFFSVRCDLYFVKISVVVG